MAAPPLSPQVFAILSALIEERTGLHYALGDLELLRAKVATRAVDAGFDSFLDYYYFLKYDPRAGPELERLVDALVVGETYFFREYDQLKALATRFVPERLERQDRVRIWSAACATGEEPLTLAMLLDRAGVRSRVELLASDLSTAALARARAGVFGRRSLRQVPEPALVDRYLTSDGERHRVDPALVAGIDWRQVNLVSAEQVKGLGGFDFILCRNVLIYFRDEVARQVVDHLTNALVPGGALLVSVSESLMRLGARLTAEEREGVFLYRRGFA